MSGLMKAVRDAAIRTIRYKQPNSGNNTSSPADQHCLDEFSEAFHQEMRLPILTTPLFALLCDALVLQNPDLNSPILRASGDRLVTGDRL